MYKLLSLWLRRPVSLIILSLIVLILGLLSVFNMPLELSPSADFPRVSITTYYPDSTPEMVEAYISAPIESRMQEIADIRNIKSISENNYSRVTLQFDRNTDMNFNLFRINEILSDYKNWLPDRIMRPSVSQYVPDEFKQESLISYRLLTELPEQRLFALVEEKIKRPLHNVAGVASVDVFGLKTPQIEILLDLAKLNKYGLSVQDVRQRLKRSKFHPGTLKQKYYRFPIAIVAGISSLGELKKIPFNIGSRVIFLDELAEIKEGYRELLYKKRINGKHTLLISLQKKSGENAVGVADRVYQTVSKIRCSLPKGNELLLVSDSTEKLRQSLSDLALRSVIAFITIIVLLMIILRSLRNTFIIVFSIMLSVLAVFISIHFLDYSVNLLTLAALALGFGFMVDNAIIVFNNIDRSLSPAQTISKTMDVIFPIMASTLTTLAALAPFLFLSDELKIYYIPFAVVVGAALISSVLFSFLFVPSSYVHLSIKKVIPGGNNYISLFSRMYETVLSFLFRFKKTVFIIFIWCIGLPLWFIPDSLPEEDRNNFWAEMGITAYNSTLGSSFYSAVREYTDPALGGATYLFFNFVQRGKPWRWGMGDYLSVYVRLPQGSDFILSEQIIREFEQIAVTGEGVDKVETTISPGAANMRIDFKEAFLHSINPYLLKDRLIQRAANVGGAFITVSGFGDGFAAGFSGSVSSFRLSLKGYNYLELKNLAIKLQKELEKNRRVRDVDINTPFYYRLSDLYELNMNLDRKTLALSGLRPSDVLSTLGLYLSETLSAEKIKIGLEEKYLQVKSSGFEDLQLDELSSKWYQSHNLPPYRLGQFAEIKKQKILPEIRRENQEYIRMLSFDFLGPFEFGKQFLDETLDSFEVPVGYKILQRYWALDEGEEQNLLFVILLGLLFIYMVTASLYESFLDPFLIFLTIPAGLIGIFLSFYLTDTIFDRSAYIGVLFISGIVVNNSIILISKFKTFQKSGLILSESVLKGCANHMRPLFLTSATTVLGFLPMLIFSNQQSGDLWYTLALTAISGILSSFIFIMFILPLLFYALENKKSLSD